MIVKVSKHIYTHAHFQIQIQVRLIDFEQNLNPK